MEAPSHRPDGSADDSGVVALGSVLDGRYRVDAVLGTGGMGRVYRGEHTGIGRPVAIKVLHASLGRNKEAAQRFQREALASGRLDHPNIVGVSDFGTLDDGCLYLVMEALDGEPLGARLEREKRIPWLEAVEIVRGVLAGLHHAHDRGVVHRDIKPDNVFLARKDGEQIIKLLDFGIAKLYAGNADDPAQTRAGLTVGTPAYLSPEQAVGGAITPASDLYSTSVVLYEMLSGRPPFLETDPLAMLTAHVSRDAPMLREVAPDVALPAGLEDVIRHGLAKVASERIGSALEYQQRLDDVLRAAGYEPPGARASGRISVPSGGYRLGTPSPGMLTPIPVSGTAPTALAPAHPATGPATAVMPDPLATHTASLPASRPPSSTHATPIPRTWWMIAAGIVAVAVIVAIIAVFASRGGKPRRAVVPVPELQPNPDDAVDAARSIALDPNRDCDERRAAIASLRQIGDERAKRALHDATRRGPDNDCVRDDARDALDDLR